MGYGEQNGVWNGETRMAVWGWPRAAHGFMKPNYVNVKRVKMCKYKAPPNKPIKWTNPESARCKRRYIGMGGRTLSAAFAHKCSSSHTHFGGVL